ncbi:MAG: hypothetical protein ABL929_11160 [Ferruginibacter sp.]
MKVELLDSITTNYVQQDCTEISVSWINCSTNTCTPDCYYPQCVNSFTVQICTGGGGGSTSGGSGIPTGGGPTGPTGGGPTGGGSGGGGSPTGGGTSGGGTSNPPNNTGWIPITIIDDDVIVQAIDSIPQVLSTVCSTQMDSLYQWGMTNGFREQSFIIVVKNGIKYPKNFTPGFPTGDKTRVNYTLAPGEQLIAYVHIHSEDTVGYYRTSFSANDLIEFNKNANIIGYTALLEVGNARYAFVLEDVQKKNAFNISKKGMHRQLYEALLNTLSSTISNGQTLTEQTWMQYLGSASISGIGFYKSSTKRGKNIFTKLNH